MNEACKEIRNAFNAHAYAAATFDAYYNFRRAQALAKIEFDCYFALIETIRRFHSGMTHTEIIRALGKYRANMTREEWCYTWLA